MKAACGLTPEKKLFEISAANAPARKKSYHSNIVPREDAIKTRVCVLRSIGALSAMEVEAKTLMISDLLLCFLVRAIPVSAPPQLRL
jgi:hypothetical protein